MNDATVLAEEPAKTEKKNRIIRIIWPGSVVEPRSSCRVASEPATAHSPASATNPRTKNTTNQPTTRATTFRMSAPASPPRQRA
jgi:hypothetical protein